MMEPWICDLRCLHLFVCLCDLARSRHSCSAMR